YGIGAEILDPVRRTARNRQLAAGSGEDFRIMISQTRRHAPPNQLAHETTAKATRAETNNALYRTRGERDGFRGSATRSPHHARTPWAARLGYGRDLQRYDGVFLDPVSMAGAGDWHDVVRSRHNPGQG